MMYNLLETFSLRHLKISFTLKDSDLKIKFQIYSVQRTTHVEQMINSFLVVMVFTFHWI